MISGLPVGADDARRLAEVDEVVLLEQLPAQVVGDLLAGRVLEGRVDLLERARRLVGVQRHDPLALLGEDADDPVGRAQGGPALALRRQGDVEVGEVLGRRVEPALRDLLGHLLGQQAHVAPAGQAADLLVGRVLVERPAHQDAVDRAHEDEQEEGDPQADEQRHRRASPGAQLHRADLPADDDQRDDERGERSQPQQRLGPQQHHEAVEDRADQPGAEQQDRDERDESGGAGGGRAQGPPTLFDRTVSTGQAAHKACAAVEHSYAGAPAGCVFTFTATPVTQVVVACVCVMASQPPHDAEMLDVRTAASVLRRNPETVRRWIWSGRLAARREGNRLLIARRDVEALADSSRDALSLAAWAKRARASREPEGRGGKRSSAADLVLEDRARRSATGRRRASR